MQADAKPATPPPKKKPERLCSRGGTSTTKGERRRSPAPAFGTVVSRFRPQPGVRKTSVCQGCRRLWQVRETLPIQGRTATNRHTSAERLCSGVVYRPFLAVASALHPLGFPAALFFHAGGDVPSSQKGGAGKGPPPIRSSNTAPVQEATSGDSNSKPLLLTHS